MILIDHNIEIENNINTADFVFYLVETDENFYPIKLLQSCFSFTNAPVLITAAHFTDIFNYSKPSFEDNLIHYPKRFKFKEYISKMAVLRINSKTNYISIHSVVGITFDTRADLALLVVEENFDVTPCLKFLENPFLNKSVSSYGYPTAIQNFNFNQNNFLYRPIIAYSTGIIIDLHEYNVRNSWYSCIEFNSQVVGGMSGGPLIDNETNMIIGINSFCFDFFDGPALATWIGKFLDLKYSLEGIIKYEDSSEFDLSSFTIRELSDFGNNKAGLIHRLIPFPK